MNARLTIGFGSLTAVGFFVFAGFTTRPYLFVLFGVGCLLLVGLAVALLLLQRRRGKDE